MSESLGTVLVAGAVNLSIAAAKLVAGVLSGSASMISESAHSAADTVTEVLLYTAIRRSERPADPAHPLGYGQSAYLWALLAACFTLVAGAGFSVTHGLHTIADGEDLSDFGVSYLVLAIAFALEGVSLAQGLRQLRRLAARWDTSPARVLHGTSDTMLKAVVFEDVAALVGLLLAAAGLGLAQLTGNVLWDGLGSVAIGVLLLVVAVLLIKSNTSLLIGQAAPAAVEEGIRAELLALPEVERVVELITIMLGPGRVLVAARIDFLDEASGASLERASAEVERRLRTRFPEIRQVFLDPTSSGEGPV
ncbi:cation diffusion facilitator family transporter [Acrocarpospora corrugata]|nr:cation diffusion facilitator family transporter [Acrocarpospora corrugata]